ncbi:MAG: peptidase M1, partial [Thermoleophilia bacterium]|nr:peptidase M1 [Thermoleophilia bacterium]
LCLGVLAGGGKLAIAQRVASIDVQHYVAQVQISPSTQNLEATVEVRFLAQEDGSRYVNFQLHNDLQLNEVKDENGAPVQFSRSYEDFTVRLALDEALRRGQERTVRFEYVGRLTGREESPVWGITFAALEETLSYLMYPARWLPVSGYTTDRFTMDLRVTVPQGYRVLASGVATSEPAPDGQVQYKFEYTQPSFPASLAVVRDEGVPVEAEGIQTTVYFRPEHKELATAFGTEVGRVMAFLTKLYGLPPHRDLVVVETGPGAPNGYAA